MENPSNQKSVQARKRRIAALRVKEIFELSGETPTEFAARMGLKYNAFNEGLQRQSFALHSVILLAENLNVSLDYLCGLTEEPSPIKAAKPTRDFWEIVKENRSA